MDEQNEKLIEELKKILAPINKTVLFQSQDDFDKFFNDPTSVLKL